MYMSGIKVSKGFYKNDLHIKSNISNSDKIMNNIRKKEQKIQELSIKSISNKLTHCNCNKCRPQN